nr:hypothetical protein [Acetivibrio straminisolvens]
MAKGTTTITGLKGFKTKESGKLSRMITELSKLGASLQETEDGVVIEGKEYLKGTFVEGHNDAAITMSLCIAGLIAENETNIRKAQILDIAYPEFITVLNRL